jgi:hypothetical protein
MLRIAIALVLVVGCRKHDKAKPAPAPAEVPDPPASADDDPPEDAPRDASEARLAPDREAFWARYVGSAGMPGPETLEFWHTTKPGESREISPDIELQNHEDYCVLSVWPDGPRTPLVRELFVVVDRWSADRSTMYTDTRDQLTTKISVDATGNKMAIWWFPYHPLDQIIGHDGQLLAGFDPSKVFGKTPLALADAITPPVYPANGNCHPDGCAVLAPGPPGAKQVQISALDDGTSSVWIPIPTALLPQLAALIEKSLGPPDASTSEDERVYHSHGIKYVSSGWAAWNGDPASITITITPE